MLTQEEQAEWSHALLWTLTLLVIVRVFLP